MGHVLYRRAQTWKYQILVKHDSKPFTITICNYAEKTFICIYTH